jgi:biotin carboxyl carrier protein
VSEKDKFSQIELENGVFETQVTRKFALRKPFERHDPGVIKAVIPGAIAEIIVKPHTMVKKGDTLMILEAMKMLNRIMAPLDGEVKAIHVKRNEKVAKGQALIEIKSVKSIDADRSKK